MQALAALLKSNAMMTELLVELIHGAYMRSRKERLKRKKGSPALAAKMEPERPEVARQSAASLRKRGSAEMQFKSCAEKKRDRATIEDIERDRKMSRLFD